MQPNTVLGRRVQEDSTVSKKKAESQEGVERPVSLSPLNIKDALCGLLAIPDPDATKPAKLKRQKAPPTPDKE